MFKKCYFQKTVSGWEGRRRGWGGERPAKKNIIRDDGKDCCPNPLQQVLENIKSNKIIFIGLRRSKDYYNDRRVVWAYGKGH